jgi:adenylate cyclase
MRVSIRVTLVAVVTVTTVTTTAAIAAYSYANAHRTAELLAADITEQTSARVAENVTHLLETARDEVALTARWVRAAPPGAARSGELVARWRDSLAVHPELTSQFIGVEATGESVGVSRLAGERMSVWVLSDPQPDSAFRLREFWADEYPRHPFTDTPRFRYDVRGRPWYRAAAQARRPVWTPAYAFTGAGRVDHVPGVTYAAPVVGAKDKLFGVVTADFDLRTLCRFLARLPVGTSGYCLLVEYGDDGARRVIAHPREELILQRGAAGELTPVSVEDSPEPAVSGLAPYLPGAMPDGVGVDLKRVRVAGRGVFVATRPLGGVDQPRWAVCTVLPEDDVLAEARRSNRSILLVGGLALLAGCGLGAFVAKHASRPLERIAGEVAAVGRLEFAEAPVGRSRIREVDDLAVATERMKAGLRSFEKYVPTALVRELVRAGEVARLGGERRELSILFTDIADFTPVAETLPSEFLVSHLSDYLALLSGEIASCHGTVDKFIGDAVMAVWNAPAVTADHAVLACRAATRCQRALAAAREGWRAVGKPLLPTRIGIHTGEAVVGNIGAPDRLNYTAVGDAVNLASRLEGLNKEYGTEILISETTYRQAAAAVVARPVSTAAVKGRTGRTVAYELVGMKGEVGEESERFVTLSTEAFAAVEAGDYPRARQLIETALTVRPADRPLTALLSRCAAPG